MGARKAEEENNNVDHGFDVLYKPVPPHNMPAVSTKRRVLVISCFDGIAALRLALARLRLPIYLYISLEIDAEARKCVRRWWPARHVHSDITKFGEPQLEEICNNNKGFHCWCAHHERHALSRPELLERTPTRP